MADGQSAPITMSAETRAVMQKVTAAISSYPSYTLKTQRDGTVLFQKSRSTSYEEAAEAARTIANAERTCRLFIVFYRTMMVVPRG